MMVAGFHYQTEGKCCSPSLVDIPFANVLVHHSFGRRHLSNSGPKAVETKLTYFRETYLGTLLGSTLVLHWRTCPHGSLRLHLNLRKTLWVKYSYTSFLHLLSQKSQIGPLYPPTIYSLYTSQWAYHNLSV